MPRKRLAAQPVHDRRFNERGVLAYEVRIEMAEGKVILNANLLRAHQVDCVLHVGAEALILFDCEDRRCETAQIRGERPIAGKRTLRIAQYWERFDIVEGRYELGDPRKDGKRE